MTRTVTLIVLAAVAAGLGASDVIGGLVDPYLRIQVALAEDRVDTVSADAKTIAATAAGLGSQGQAIKTAATRLASSRDLKAAREAFGVLSEAVIAYANATRLSTPDLNLAYCSMVGKSWLQKGEKIANPYYGSEMLTCGEIRKPAKAK
jgi:hypothetical protein